jgi:hypothetical protein
MDLRFEFRLVANCAEKPISGSIIGMGVVGELWGMGVSGWECRENLGGKGCDGAWEGMRGRQNEFCPTFEWEQK